jgi:leader peptidase (prepilin peptidase)/N-methyltransferase
MAAHGRRRPFVIRHPDLVIPPQVTFDGTLVLPPMFSYVPPAAIPFHFWSVVFFIFGSMVGSFLNVCIYRMPRDMSVVTPRSHCPNCGYMIPAVLNLPLFTWLFLRGKCANCKSPISVRYFLVELLTGALFLGCWWSFGSVSLFLALACCILLAGFVVATFIDLEHFIIPDEITFGGIAVGFLCSFVAPELHRVTSPAEALKSSAIGIAVGGGLIYGILRLGKLAFGRQRLKLAAGSRVIFTETSLVLPTEEIPFGDIFYRKSDTIMLESKQVELPDRCYWNVPVHLSPSKLRIGDEVLNPEEVSHMEIVSDQITLPQEAMGLGDVKFMAAIGAFLGWQAVAFSLMFSAILGSIVGVTAIAIGRREWSSRLPYGPYIALAATGWVFLPPSLQTIWLTHMSVLVSAFTGGSAGRIPPPGF